VIQSFFKNKDKNHHNGYILKIGDIMKFGQVQFKISEMRKKNLITKKFDDFKCKNYIMEQNHSLKDKIFDVTNQVQSLKMKKSKHEEEEEFNCRYCLLDSICEDEVDDLLIHPCDCSGGSEYVHVLCLRRWIEKKIVSENSKKLITYKINNLECEVCKKKWPMVIKYNDTYRRLFDIEKPECAYIIFEQLSNPNKDDDNEESNVIRMILENNGEIFTIGQSLNNSFTLNHASIDNYHASIQYVNGEFILKDCDSRFGTLVKMREDWEIDENKIAIQVGKTVFSIFRRVRRLMLTDLANK
jgi:hypothetical protein